MRQGSDRGLAIVMLTDNTAAITGVVTNATGDIRYNVVAVDGMFGGERNMKALTVRSSPPSSVQWPAPQWGSRP